MKEKNNDFLKDIRLISSANKFYFMAKLIKALFLIFKNLIVRNLISKRPLLILFDLYKLGYYYKYLIKVKKLN